MTRNQGLDAFLSSDRPWLADGGLETELIFNHDIDLPHFASLFLFETEKGRVALDRYLTAFLELAETHGTGFMVDTATWRSGGHWTEIIGLSADRMKAANHVAVEAAQEFIRMNEGRAPMLINGAVGPAGDGYQPEALHDPETARMIHSDQIGWLAEAGVDMVTAVTMTHAGEAIGFLHAAREIGVPAAVSFTVETDGRLPTGQEIGDAIAETDAATDGQALYFMVNCAHPDHFSGQLSGDWLNRIGGVRANASRMSHAELDVAEELDDGNPAEFGELYGAIARVLPNLRVIGGCCGSDHRHVGCAAHHVVHQSAHAA